MVNELTCPNCSTMMRTNQRYGVDIDFCPSCKGVWLDRGEIEKIANASKRYDEDPVYSNERSGNHEGQPREIRRYQSNDYRVDNDFKSPHYGYKKKNEEFSMTNLILIKLNSFK